MKRVLIISPHFSPVNAADSHRVRHALAHLRENGWEPVVLAVTPAEVTGAVIDSLLERTYPNDIAIHRVGALPAAYTRHVGMGTLGLRCFPFIARAGARLMKAARFDVVFFSTTQFAVMALGPRWKRQFAVPYVLDFQDPWVSDYHSSDDSSAPGGRWKYRFAQWQARRLEPRAVRQSAQVICVSDRYPAMLRKRYPDVPEDRFSVLPFATSREDFETARSPEAAQRVFDPKDGREHWVYVGRGGSDMVPAARVFLGALARGIAKDPALGERVRVDFVGTSYAADRAAPSFLPLAAEMGLSGIVTEKTTRIPYFEGLRCLLDASVVLLLGSDDPSYSASKIYPCLFSERPVLAIVRGEGAAARAIAAIGGATVVPIDSAAALTANSAAVQTVARYITDPPRRLTEKPCPKALQAVSAAIMTAHLAMALNEATVSPSANAR